MRNKLTILALVLLAYSVQAEPLRRTVSIASIGTNSTLSITNDITGIRGWIEDIVIDVTGAGATGRVTIASVADGEAPGASTVNICTNTLTADALWRPRFDATDLSGAALTSDPPERFAVCGETVRYVVDPLGATGVTFKAIIKWEDGR